MNKRMLSVIAVLAWSAVRVVSANDIEPTKEFYSATHINKPVVLDGVLSEWVGVPVLADPKFAVPKFSGTNAHPTYVLFEQYSGGTWSGPNDQTSAVQVAWDADNVYFGFVVTDDYHENVSGTAWNGDSVQLMIADGTRTQQVALYNYALGGYEDKTGALVVTDGVIINHEAGPGGTDAIVTRDGVNKKTIYEIKLPATSLGLTAPLTAGIKFGLGMAINDGDGALVDGIQYGQAGQDGQRGWGGLGAHAIVFGKTPSETALVTLSTNLPSTDKVFLSAINPTIVGFSFRANDKGAAIVNPTSAKLIINGQTNTLTASPKVGDATDFTFKPAGPFPSGAINTYSIIIKDTQGNTVTDSGTFITPVYALLPPASKVTADTNKPGFLWNIFANSANTANNNQRSEDALAGKLLAADGTALPNLADPAAQGVAIAPATAPNPANAPLKFEISGVINLSRADQSTLGDFTPDGQMPGVPATDGSTDGMAAEIITYLDLPAGLLTMGVNSDDGFRTTAGNVQDAFQSVFLGEYSGGRGASDTIFNVFVPEAGIYPFRTTWEQGGGDANIEWFSVGVDGTKVLLNDLANGGIKAYRAKIGGTPSVVKSVSPSPVPRQIEQTSSSVSVVLVDGTTNKIDDTSVVLQIDGQTVTPTKARQGSTLILTWIPTVLEVPGDKHTASLTFKDTVSGASRTEQWSFYNLQNLILPASPVTGENFDSYPEASSAANTVPPGWVATNFTFLETPGWDLTDVKSDAFVNWVLITTDTVLPLEKEVLDNDTSQTINGLPVTNWISGKLLFAASDGRAKRDPDGNRVGQIQYVVSKGFDLTTVTNPLLTFDSAVRISSGEPEADAVEYSINKGTNWLPVIYMQNKATLKLSPDGTYDAIATFLTVDTNNIAQWPTPGVGPLGAKFGDAIKAPISQALAPFIAERNDDRAARKVEAIRLPLASKQSDVRLRFSHYGSCGWEWGIDNIAFYDAASSSGGQTPSLKIARSGNSIVLTFTGTLQQASAVSGPWSPVTGTSPQTITSTAGTKFYRATQ